MPHFGSAEAQEFCGVWRLAAAWCHILAKLRVKNCVVFGVWRLPGVWRLAAAWCLALGGCLVPHFGLAEGQELGGAWRCVAFLAAAWPLLGSAALDQN